MAPKNSSRIANTAEDELRLRPGFARRPRDGAPPKSMAGRLTKLMTAQRGRLFQPQGSTLTGGDRRQQVIVKLSFHNHFGGAAKGGAGGPSGSGGGGGGLSAHGRYLERDGAGRDGERGAFYDRGQDVAEDARDRMRDWAENDPRHFRLMLAAERGERLADPKDFTRDVMDRVERDLGVQLDWLAVDHHNTDNSHTHIIIRGLRRDGAPLLIPRDYVARGLRDAAREIATQHLGERSPADDRARLLREIEARGLTRLDRAMEQAVDANREVQFPALESDALRARARALERMGLAEEVRRNTIRMAPDWRDRLEAMGPIDVRRELARGRVYEQRMGRIQGLVLSAGPRGEHGERGLLVLETQEHGRVLLNTSREAVRDLEPGMIAELTPRGRRATIEQLSDRPISEQVRAPGFTQLDQALERMALGRGHDLPALDTIDRALSDRAENLTRAGLGARGRDGIFQYTEAGRELLADRDREQVGRDLADRSGRTFVDVRDPLHREWKLEQELDLPSGRAGVLGRSGALTVAQLARNHGLEIGDPVRLERNQSQARGMPDPVKVVRDIGREFGRDR